MAPDRNWMWALFLRTPGLGGDRHERQGSLTLTGAAPASAGTQRRPYTLSGDRGGGMSLGEETTTVLAGEAHG